VSGDARRALNLASKAHVAGFATVGIKEMDEVINSNCSTGRAPGIAALPADQRLVLLAMYNMTSVSETVGSEQLLTTCWQLARTASLCVPHHTDIARAMASLVSMGVLAEQQRGRLLSLSAVNRDDLSAVLLADPLLSRFVVK
jgi:Cdc6-like AAA superfamily ATPase